MTGLLKGVVIGICGAIPAGTLFLLFASVNKESDRLEISQRGFPEIKEASVDIADVPMFTEAEMYVAPAVAPDMLVDEFSPIRAIKQRDTMGSMSMDEALKITGVSRRQINHSIVEHRSVEGYLFEFDGTKGIIRVLMPPDTSVYPNIEDASVLTGLPKELIVLSIIEQKTVEGTKFEYEK